MATIEVSPIDVAAGLEAALLNVNINLAEIDVVVGPDQFINASTTGTIAVVENNRTFYCGTRDNKLIDVVTAIEAGLLNVSINSAEIDVITALEGGYVAGTLISDAEINVITGIYAEWYILAATKNWVMWSKIGEASFEIDRTNEAGSRPMDWSGYAWQVRQLDKVAVIYGSNGITVMTPVKEPAATFGFNDISQVGLKSPNALATTKHVHFFITSKGELWKLSKEGTEKLGYDEFLAPMSNPILSFDELEQRLFISDGTNGYVYQDGLGGGYATLTGITDSHVAASDELAVIPFSLMTDMIDMGQRGIKTITCVEIGISTIQPLYAALDYRYSKGEDWRTSPWVLVNLEGHARIQIAGVEFRVRLKQETYDEVRIDYINLRHQRPDKRFIRGPLSDKEGQ